MECTLYLAEGCNLSCSYCYEGINKNKEKMSLDTLKKSLDFIVTHNFPGDRIDLVFLGGEPLLNKECLFQAVDMIKKEYPGESNLFHYAITTNGTLIDDNCLRFFKENEFQVSISIDGDKDTHNLNRHSIGNENTYDFILENFEKLQRRNIDVSARMTVTANNVKYLAANVGYLLHRGAKKIHIGLDMLADWSSAGVRLLDRELNLVDTIYLEQVAPIADRIIDIYDYKLSTFVIKHNPLYCSAGTENHLLINSRGEIFPCGYVGGDERWKLGTVCAFDKTNYLKPVRKHVRTKSSCQGCPIAFTCCGAKCGFLNFVKTGYLNQHHKETCQIQKVLFNHNCKVVAELYKRKSQRIMYFFRLAEREKLDISDVMKKMIGETEDIDDVQSDIGAEPNL